MTYWCDANLLLRLLTKTPAEHFGRARALVQRAEDGEIGLKIHPLSVAEVIYVLLGVYAYDRVQIAHDLKVLLSVRALQVQEMNRIIAALDGFATKKVDFQDLYLAETAILHGEGVASFDRDFQRLGVIWLEP